MPLKVLTVDDSKTIRMIVRKAFTPFDCELFEGENGVEGLASAAREKPDLIVLDITMPVMSGAEMLEKLRNEEILKKIPVIMLTAESGKENVMKIIKMGVQDYMVKPFKGEQLIERAAKLIKLTPRADTEASGEAGKRYFILDGDVYRLALPATINRITSSEVENALKTKSKEIANGGACKLVLDLSNVGGASVPLIRLLVTIFQHCQNAGVAVRLMGTAALGNELKEFRETSTLNISTTFEEARAAF